MERSEIYKVIDGERNYQNSFWNAESDLREHDIASFVLYMEHQLSLARTAAATSSPQTPALEHLRKVVALGVKCFEIHGVPERV